MRNPEDFLPGGRHHESTQMTDDEREALELKYLRGVSKAFAALFRHVKDHNFPLTKELERQINAAWRGEL